MKKISQSGKGVLYTAGTFLIPVLKGSYKEMGTQYGELMKDEMQKAYDIVVQPQIDKGIITHEVSKKWTDRALFTFSTRNKDFYFGLQEGTGWPIEKIGMLDQTIEFGVFQSKAHSFAGCTSILAGLRSPTGGTFSIGSSRVSVLPDTPKFEPWLTARETVLVSATLADVPNSSAAVSEILKRTGLNDAADRRVNGFSRGMLQRLGLATAVVSRPDLLLLDEPAAALDPQGRREVLDLVTDLRGESTVIFSSHILDDVQEVCDEIAILVRGSLRYRGTLDSLVRDTRPGYTYRVVIRGPDASAIEALQGCDWVTQVDADGDELFVTADAAAALESRLVPLLSEIGVPVISLGPVERSLEDVFLEVTR